MHPLRIAATFVLALAVALGVISMASAAPPQEISFGQTFTSDAYVSIQPAGASGAYQIVDIATGYFSGALTGTLTETDYFLLHADGSGNFHGVDTCVCTLDGRSGTLLIRYTGTLAADGTFVSPFVIVHATGDLAGLRGDGVSTGVFTGVTPYSFTNVLRYHFTSAGS